MTSHGQGSQPAWVAAVGDPNDPRTFSGTALHFLRAGERHGLLRGGLPLRTDRFWLRAHRMLWNLRQPRDCRSDSAYMTSAAFLETLWRPFVHQARRAPVINVFQLYPPSIVADDDVLKWFYTDITRQQFYDMYPVNVGPTVKQDVIDREREGYHQAAGILVHCRWVAESLMRDYQTPREKIHVVVPGANFDNDAYAEWERRDTRRSNGETLQLCFVGQDWQRKGLDRLLRAMKILAGRNIRMRLRVIGQAREHLPSELAATADVEWLGRIDKRTEPLQLLEAMSACDAGVLLSRAEAGGMVLREFQALGVPVIGPRTGGSPEFVFPDASQLVEPAASDTDIADLIEQLVRTGWFEQAKHPAWERRHEATWEHAMQQISAVWANRS